MTVRELEYKLAKDIARIRIVTRKSDEPDTTMSAELIRVMHRLDDAAEEDLLKEIDSKTADSASSERLMSIMTDSYLESIKQKLRTRITVRAAGKKKIHIFTGPEKKRAIDVTIEEATKAAKLIKKDLMEDATASGAVETVINAAAAEAYGYDLPIALEKILDILKADKDIRKAGMQDLQLEVLGFMPLASDAIEFSEVNNYYGKWIYEHFQPIGLLKIKATKS